MQSREQRKRAEQPQRGSVGFRRHCVVRERDVARDRGGQGRRHHSEPTAVRGGIGAIEIGVRYDQLTFESAGKTGPDVHEPAVGAPDAQHRSTLTFGVNWLLNRWVKVVVNGLRQTFDDEQRVNANRRDQQFLVGPYEVAGRLLIRPT